MSDPFDDIDLDGEASLFGLDSITPTPMWSSATSSRLTLLSFQRAAFKLKHGREWTSDEGVCPIPVAACRKCEGIAEVDDDGHCERCVLDMEL